MKAIILNENGGTEKLIFTEISKPQIQDHEVLIRVKAIGINPVDAFVRQHADAMSFIVGAKPDEQVIIGWDVSGIVEETGSRVTTWKPGDEVFGMVNFPGQGKAYAEYVAAPADQLTLKPVNISHEGAAAATLAALTAWQALVTHGKLKAGEKVLIHAAGGGVGHYAIQIAKYLGAHVTGTGSAGKKDFILGLGADAFIDHTTVRFEEIVRDADLVLDSLFGDHVFRSVDAVREGGRVITLLTFFTDEKLVQKVKEKEVYAHRLNVISSGEDMKQIAALLEAGNLRSYIAASYHFDEMRTAHAAIEKGSTAGKIVVTIPS